MTKCGLIQICVANVVDEIGFEKLFFRAKTVSAEKYYKKQQHRVNNLKKQANELFYANINENLDELNTTDSKMYWKTIHMLNECSANTMPPLRDRANYFNSSYHCFEKAALLNRHVCSISDLNDKNKDLPPSEVRCKYILSHIVVSEQDIVYMIST